MVADRGVRGHLLVTDQHMAQRSRIIERVVQGKRRPARVPENGVDARAA